MKIILGILLLTLASFAQIGTIASIKGSATVLRGDELMPALKGFVLEAHDIVKTSKRSKIKIVFSDDTVVTLGQNSELDIKAYSDTPFKENVEMHFVKGVFESVTGQIGKIAPKKFQISTSTSSIGIRGTTVLAQVIPQKDIITCSDGEIAVTEHTTGATVIVPKGYFTTVNAGAKPSAPKKTSQPTEVSKKELMQLSSSVDVLLEAENAAKTLSTVETAEAPTLSTGWGYWATDGSLYQADDATFLSVDLATVALYQVGGTATPSSVIDTYIGSLASTSYSGSIYGHIDDRAGTLTHIDGNFLLDVDFGAALPMHLEMKFQDASEKWWITFDGGAVDNSGFSINDTDAAYTFSKIAGGDIDAINTAEINGNFYGSTAESVGATFALEGVRGDGAVHTAQGVLVMP